MKIAAIVETLRRVFSGTLPDVIGLCEIGSYSIGQHVSRELTANSPTAAYHSVWSGLGPNITIGARTRYSTGLLVLFNPTTIQRLREPLEHSPNVNTRAKWLGVPFKSKIGSGAEFWFVVNHWKSAVKVSEAQMFARQMESGVQIGEFYQRPPIRPTVLIGDFNCEPFDIPFLLQKVAQQSSTRFKGVRERNAAMGRSPNGHGGIAYFYNPMWRLLGDPEHWEASRVLGYTASRPTGTFLPMKRKTGWKTLDQVLVSRQMLDGNQITLIESSAHIVSAYNQCSDHCALGWEFDVTEGRP